MDESRRGSAGPPRLPSVDVADGQGARRPPIGVLAAAFALLVAAAMLGAAIVGVPPFRSLGSPSPVPSLAPSPSPGSSPSPSASPTPLTAGQIDALVTQIEERMVQLRELDARAPVASKLVTTVGATGLLTADFRTHNPGPVLADQALLYRALGLLGPSDDLGAIFERFLSTQVLGFYRTEDESLYVISDQAFGPLQELTTAHEYTHALQDQHFGLDALIPEGHDQGDLDLARHALIEGDATLAMTQWAVAELTPDELADLLSAMADPAAQQVLAELPPIVRETAEFPYAQGLAFVQRAWQAGGWASVDQLWRQPPATSEQILHPEKYDGGEQAIRVALPKGLAAGLGAGWKLALQDTQGELVIRIWLETAVPADTAATAAQGWGGDRIGLYRGPNDAWAVVWLTRWDSAADSREFEAAARSAAAKLGPASVKSGPAGVTVAVASDAAVLDRLTPLLP